jgi:hypothetical protein
LLGIVKRVLALGGETLRDTDIAAKLALQERLSRRSREREGVEIRAQRFVEGTQLLVGFADSLSGSCGVRHVTLVFPAGKRTPID